MTDKIAIGSDRMKGKVAHEVPLLPMIAAVLPERPHNANRCVFGKRRTGFSGFSQSKEKLDKKLAAMGLNMEPWRLHDLRWTFSTRLHDAGVDPIVIEALLAHKQHVIILSFGGLGGPAIAQSDYPVRPIRLIVGYAAGGLTDVMTRMLGERMSRELGQPIVVENKPGAATVSPPLLSLYQHPTVILF